MWILLPASAFPAVRAQATEKGANMQTYSVLTDEYAFTAAKTDAFITPSVFNSADKMPTEAENEDGTEAVKESEPLSIRALLARRMRLCGLGHVEISCRSESRLMLNIADDDELRLFARALSELMLVDLRYFEFARMVDMLPFSVDEKKKILPCALGSAPESDPNMISERVFDYLCDNSLLNLNGFLRFRLQDVIESWQVSVDIAAEEFLLIEEYNELLQILGLFSDVRPTDGTDVLVILQPDGSCTVTDGDKLRIDCAPNSNEGVLSMLTGMAPSHITLFDFSNGACDKLCRAICLLFGTHVEKD